MPDSEVFCFVDAVGQSMHVRLDTEVLLCVQNIGWLGRRKQERERPMLNIKRDLEGEKMDPRSEDEGK